MNNPASLLTALALFVSALSCGRFDAPVHKVGRGEVLVRLEVQDDGTKSSCRPSSSDKITDINVWVYREGRLYRPSTMYLSGLSGNTLSVSLPDDNVCLYDIYFFANVGRVDGPENESDVGEASAEFDDYSSFAVRGFPMAAAVKNYSPTEDLTVSLQRLVGRYDIYINRNPLNTKMEYALLSCRLRSCARTVRPFGRLDGFSGYASRARTDSEIISEGDSLTPEDIETLNAGGVVSLYYLENCQGDILSGNMNPYDKTPEKIFDETGDPGRAALCSYLELTYRAVSPTAIYENVRYRTFLGQNQESDFSILRNTSTRYKLDFVANQVWQDEWFCLADPPTVTAKLRLCENLPAPSGGTLEDYRSLDEDEPLDGFWDNVSFYVMNGVSKVYYLWCSNPDIDYRVSGAALPSGIGCKLEPCILGLYYSSGMLKPYTSEHWKMLTVSATLDGTDPVLDAASLAEHIIDGTIYISSYDNVLMKALSVRAINGSLKGNFDWTGETFGLCLFDPFGFNCSCEYMAEAGYYAHDGVYVGSDDDLDYVWIRDRKASGFNSRLRDESGMHSRFYDSSRTIADMSATGAVVYNNYSRPSICPDHCYTQIIAMEMYFTKAGYSIDSVPVSLDPAFDVLPVDYYKPTLGYPHLIAYNNDGGSDGFGICFINDKKFDYYDSYYQWLQAVCGCRPTSYSDMGIYAFLCNGRYFNDDRDRVLFKFVDCLQSSSKTVDEHRRDVQTQYDGLARFDGRVSFADASNAAVLDSFEEATFVVDVEEPD